MPKPKHSKRKGRPRRTKSDRHTHPQKHAAALPEIVVLEVTAITEEGEVVGTPIPWRDERRRPPHIIIHAGRAGDAPALGQHVLCRLRRVNHRHYTATVVRLLPEAGPQRILGVYRSTPGGGLIEPVSRKMKESWMVMPGMDAGAESGELVLGESLPHRRGEAGLRRARVGERLGRMDAPRAASLVAIHLHDIPFDFPCAAVSEAEAATAPTLESRADLRDIPLITIDGEDARDFDDAVWAEPDAHKDNPGGWHLVVAIADVAHYVTPGSVLDAEAMKRGNSVYFPDRVVPMLPEALSAGLCSLMPGEDRHCLAVHLWIDAEGHTLRSQFVRGLMRSRARMTYEQVQSIADQHMEHPLADSVVRPLYGAFAVLERERQKRGALELDLREYRIKISPEGKVTAIFPRLRLDSHRLIEAFMIAANVAAAQWLLERTMPAIYRVHEPPGLERTNDLRLLLEHLGYPLSKGEGIRPSHFNKVIRKAKDRPESDLVQNAILRSQTQAYYSHENKGHFGLALTQYTHFTSPIRRYSDLVVHRALIAVMTSGKRGRRGGETLASVGEHISMTERRAMLAERDAADRYRVAYMAAHLGESFSGVVTGVNEFGLFVTLSGTGVTGFVPVRALGSDFFHHDKKRAALVGRRGGARFDLGLKITVRVREANTMTGSLLFEPEWREAEPPAVREHGDKRRKDRHEKHGRGGRGKRR